MIRLKHSASPRYGLNMALYMPSYVHIGDSVSLRFEIKHDEQPTGLLEVRAPPVEMTWWKAELVRHVAMAVNITAPVQLQRVIVACQTTAYENKPISYRDTGSGYTGPELALGSAFFGTLVIPDFATNNIAVTHKLKVAMTLKMSGKMEICNFEAPLKVFSRRRNAGDPGEITGFVEGPQDTSEDWGPHAEPLIGLRASAERKTRKQKINEALSKAELASNIVDLASAL